MGLEQVSGTTAAATPVDYERFRLRAFVQALDGSELERRGACKLSEVARVLDANPKAVLFDTPGGPLVGNALASLKRRERLPLSVVVGGHPVDYFGATMRMPGDELNLLASLRACPMPVVKCVSNDLTVPADAEWVLEGYLGEEGYVQPEGPYGEFLGYYGGVKINPIFHVTAVTRRKDALFQT